ncbi:YPP1 [Candida theae]|uniref:Cargo-transport protein YPP1 n=1 Tax=Candida theae TaxID=1198502 RepID=A0AAD5FWQ6_9ASCO|nr:YPP1 [Candida theae]KAI5949166.1 YPP1 [Candida theae]
MLIENSENEKYIKTINFGCYPKNVLQLQNSQDFLQQLIFIDYQLKLLVQNEFHGQELTSVQNVVANGGDSSYSPKEKLLQLINYTTSINSNHPKPTRTYEANLYYTVLMAHLLYIDGNLLEMNKLLTSIKVSFQVSKNLNVSASVYEFIQYLTVRYYVLLGLSNQNGLSIWTDYLNYFNKPFTKSHVVANYWLDLLLGNLAVALTKNRTIQLSFVNQLTKLPFYKNKLAIIAFANFLLRPESSRLVNQNFKQEYTEFLVVDINECIHSRVQFPDAHDENTQVNDFTNNLYESLSYVPFNLAIFKPDLSKQFLVDAMKKTYQSRVVISNFIYTLIDLNEFDEALAAFNTYIDYLEKDQELKNGQVDDILAIIDTYSTCIIHFNPLKSFRNHPKFKFTEENVVLQHLRKYVDQLQNYMSKLAELIDLTYDDENYAGDRNPLSFLYRKYNLNVLQSDHSQFIELISKAWHSIGYFHNYFALCESTNQKILDNHVSQVLSNYKNSLIVNSTGNVVYLFHYALALANTGQLKPSLKLCKFILKRYPESFKTWNLLVLLITSFNNNDEDVNKPASFYDNILPDNLLNDVSKVNGKMNGIDQQVDSTYTPPKLEIREPEKYINKALNISGLYILKHKERDIKLPTDAKYEIMQLKLTQLAVLESVHGSQYMMNYITEAFLLYHELFEVSFNTTSSTGLASSRNFGAHEKWSHRPSFIDPIELQNVGSNQPAPVRASSPTSAAYSVSHTSAKTNPVATKNVSLVNDKDGSHVKRTHTVDRLRRLSKLPKSLPKPVLRSDATNRRDSISSLKSVGSAPGSRIKKPDFFKNGNDSKNAIVEKSLSPSPSRTGLVQNSNHVAAPAPAPGSAAAAAAPVQRSAPIHTTPKDNILERKLLQELWLWTARVFLKNDLHDECEECIGEAESIYEPNIKTFIATGQLSSKSKKFLSLQEYERSLEILQRTDKYNKIEFGYAILGLAKLFVVDDVATKSLFISTRDMDAAIIRLKNMLEQYSLSWPVGSNNSEVWFYLSKIYEIIDDKILLTRSLWKCVELEDSRPVRSFEVCNSSM